MSVLHRSINNRNNNIGGTSTQLPGINNAHVSTLTRCVSDALVARVIQVPLVACIDIVIWYLSLRSTCCSIIRLVEWTCIIVCSQRHQSIILDSRNMCTWCNLLSEVTHGDTLIKRHRIPAVQAQLACDTLILGHHNCRLEAQHLICAEYLSLHSLDITLIYTCDSLLLEEQKQSTLLMRIYGVTHKLMLKDCLCFSCLLPLDHSCILCAGDGHKRDNSNAYRYY